MCKGFPRTLSESETQRLLASIDDERGYAIVAVLLDTGIQVGELASITREALSPSRIKVSGKSGDRIVPISQAGSIWSADKATRAESGRAVEAIGVVLAPRA